MDNYSFIQKLLLFNSISVIVTLILAIGPEIQLVQTHSASLIIQITIFIISILNWVLEKKYIFLNKDEELNHKFQKISIVIWILCFLLSTSDLYFRENNIDSLEFLSTLILISV